MNVLMTLNNNGQAITLSNQLKDKAATDGANLAKLIAKKERQSIFAQTFPTGTHAMWGPAALKWNCRVRASARAPGAGPRPAVQRVPRRGDGIFVSQATQESGLKKTVPPLPEANRVRQVFSGGPFKNKGPVTYCCSL